MPGARLLLLCVTWVAGAAAEGAAEGLSQSRRLKGDDGLANYGNSVLVGHAPPRPDLSTRINSKVMADPASSPPQGPPRTHTFISSLSGTTAPQKDIADILTNLQILNILTTQDAHALPAHLQDALMEIQQDPVPSQHQAPVYHMSASKPPLAEVHYHQYFPDHAPETAGPPLASPFALPPLNAPPTLQELTGSSEINPPTSTHPAHSASTPSDLPSGPTQSIFSPAHSGLSPAHTASSPAHSTTSPAQSVSGPAHSPPGSTHSVFSPAHSPSPSQSGLAPAHSASTPPQTASSPAPSPFNPAHYPFRPTQSIFDTVQSIPGPAPPPKLSDEGQGSSKPLAPPPGLDLSHVVNQLLEDDTASPATPSLAQLTALRQYLQWLKQQQSGASPSEEMILASLLHQYNQQHSQAAHSPPLPPAETPYVPALHGPFTDPQHPYPPAPILPPAPIAQSVVEADSSLPQADALPFSSGGGLGACVSSGACALVFAFLLAGSITAAFAVPAALPAFSLFGGRRRRAAVNDDSLMLEYLKHNHASLLAEGIARMEAEMERRLDPHLLQTLEEGNPRYLLPLLQQTLGSPAPRSPRLLRQICDVVVSPIMPPSEAKVMAAQYCLLLASARRL